MDRRHCNRDGVLSCALCTSSSRETSGHLFFTCQFSVECWLRIGVDWSSLPSAPSLPDRLHLVKACVPARIHREVFLSVAWELWKCRNDKIFNDITPSVSSWLARLRVSPNVQSCRFNSGSFDLL
ncbi:hypothetical protein BRADI_1g43345v3 [Brachypodium distachyon]|uniref:Reverse transcriptase zinc-binding domain-containing protein n=1 Tax=Brachypodium distachyon TaxID=15368 RepID=A0A2K2DP44_BRADI|nr:hypothetical protein BRADI_1g43345v3 [Brachypodium distachyon]